VKEAAKQPESLDACHKKSDTDADTATARKSPGLPEHRDFVIESRVESSLN
jgi:hypothetical protein